MASEARDTALTWRTVPALLMVVSLAVGGAAMARAQEKPRTDRYGDPLPEGALARLGTIRFRQGFITHQVAFSPNGKIVACAAVGRGVCLWDAATGKELRQIGRATHAQAVAFSPKGKMLACHFHLPSRGTALFDTATGRKVIDLPDDVGGYPIGLAFAPDGKTIAAGNNGLPSGIQFFDAATGAKRKMEVSSDKEGINRMAWAPDSKRIAWIGDDGFVHLWDAIKGEEVGQWKAHDGSGSCVAFSPDGNTLATSGLDKTVCLWAIVTRKKKYTLGAEHTHVPSLIFSRDGRLLASGHGDGTIALWDAAKGEIIRRWQAQSSAVWSLDFSPDGITLVSGAIWECGPRLWNAATGAEVRPFAGHTASVHRVLFSPGGKRLFSVGRDQRILDWDLTNERETLRLQLPFNPAFWSMNNFALSPRGDQAACWRADDDTIRQWDIPTGKERGTLSRFRGRDKDIRLFEMEFSPDGRMLAVGTKDAVVTIYDSDSGAVQRRFEGLHAEAFCIAFSPDGKRVAAGSKSAGGLSTIALWDRESGKSLAQFACRERVDSLVFSPDGKMLASGAWSGAAPHLWDARTGREVRPLRTAPELYGVAFAPDGKWLAGAGAENDQKVHIWEVNTGLEVQAFRGHRGAIMRVAFAPDGRTLASGGCDSSILLWDFTGRVKGGRLQSAKWTPQELEKRWIDLASVDGPKAVQALWDFVAASDQAVLLLRQRIKPVEAVDAQRVERLIRGLDSENYQTRTKATEDLEKLVDGAEPVLRKKLAEKPSLEVRQRIQQVLSKLEPSVPGERLRALRAIQVLEYGGTSAAREHLRALAKGVPHAQLTREAKAALQRLSK